MISTRRAPGRGADVGPPRPGALVLLLLVLAGCDLGLHPDDVRRPWSVKIELDRDPITVGESTTLRAILRDQHGVPFDVVPDWVVPLWTTEDARIEVTGSTVRALEPGGAAVDVVMAERTGTRIVRVNPVDVKIETYAHLSQGIQRWDGGIPLVADREAFLRVFVRADQPNFFTPSIEARFFRGDELTGTVILPPREGIPTQMSEGELAWSFNATVPPELVLPGTSLVVEVASDGAVPLREGSQVRFPAAGRLTLDVRRVPPFRIRFVPVVQQGRVPKLTEENVEEYMAAARRAYPLAEIEMDVRRPYHTSTARDDHAGWAAILNEIRVLRIMDRSSAHYHGIMGGDAVLGGIAYMNHPVGLSHDDLPAAAWTVAHELGHNFGRRHAPCGDPVDADPAFPHPDGRIGTFGIDTESHRIVEPSRADLMGYCWPQWVSDYTFTGVMAYRQQAARVAEAEAAGPTDSGPGLLLWGRITGDSARIEPPLRVEASTAPPAAGSHRLRGLDESGALLFTTTFATEEVADGPSGEHHFAFTLPLDEVVVQRLREVRIESGGVAGAARVVAAEMGMDPAEAARSRREREAGIRR